MEVNSVKDDMKSEKLVTKKDLEVVKLELQKEISNTKVQTLIWMGINTAFMLGIMAQGFYWW